MTIAELIAENQRLREVIAASFECQSLLKQDQLDRIEQKLDDLKGHIDRYLISTLNSTWRG